MRRRFNLFVGCVLVSSAGALSADSRADDRSRSTDVAALTKSLRDPDANVRKVAARRLGELGAAAKSSVPSLLPLLQDKHEFVRHAAAFSLFSLGAPGERMLPLLQDRNDSVKVMVAIAFVKSKQNQSAALRKLVDLAIHNGRFARDALLSLGPNEARAVVPMLCSALGDNDSHVRSEALQILRAITPFIPDETSQLALLLDDKRPTVRLAVIELLEGWDEGTVAVAPRLRQLLQDPDDKIAIGAAEALYCLDQSSPEAIAILLEAMSSASVQRYNLAVSALYERGAANDMLLGALLKRIADDDADAREKALWALGDSSHVGPGIIRELLDVNRPIEVRELAARLTQKETPAIANSLLTLALRDPAMEVRLAASEVAKDVPNLFPANSAILEQSLGDPSVKLRIAVARTLIHHGRGTPEILQLLLSMLKQEDAEDVLAAVKAMGEMKSAAEPAVPTLIKALSDPKFVPAGVGDASVNIWIARTLGDIGPVAVPALITALRDPDIEVRGRAAQALQDIGAGASAAVPELIERLKDLNVRTDNVSDMFFEKSMRADAVEALGRIGPGAKAAVPHLIALLAEKREQQRDESERIRLATALGQIGKDARAALPALREVAKVDDVRLLLASNAAIASIDPTDASIVPNLHVCIEKLLRDHSGGRWIFTTDTIPDIVRVQGAKAASLKPILLSMISETPLLVPRHRVVAALSLLYLDPANEAALVYLRRASKYSDRNLAQFAAEGLAEFEKSNTAPKK